MTKKRKDMDIWLSLIAAQTVSGQLTDSGLHFSREKTSDPEKRTFNKTVVNRLFTFLTYYFGESDEASKLVFLNLAARYYPDDWDLPELDDCMVTEVREALKKGLESKLPVDALGNQTSF